MLFEQLCFRFFSFKEDLLDVMVQLATKSDGVCIKSLKGKTDDTTKDDLLLDSATMLIKEGN